MGHCHPAVTEAINKQNALLQHTTTIYLNNQIAEYAKELADRMPGNLKVRGSCHLSVQGVAMLVAAAAAHGYDLAPDALDLLLLEARHALHALSAMKRLIDSGRRRGMVPRARAGRAAGGRAL